MTPKFISFEGTEGVGKTTAIDNFCTLLTTQNIPFVRTREPGGSDVAEKLRDIFLNKDNAINADTEILMIFTARADHLHKVILPALADGKWVICDRFLDSTVAYQGFGRYHGDVAYLDKINLLATHFIPRLPDLTLWLDLDVRLGMERAGRRGAMDRLESETMAFFDRVYQGFLYQYQNHPHRIQKINANQPPDDVANDIYQAVFK